MSWSGDVSELDLTQGTASPRRSRSGCTLCRARKVKCDESWPTCTNCKRLKLSCPGPPGPGSSGRLRQRRRAGQHNEFTQAGTLRQRVAKSCQQCRAAKARCSGDTICTRCSRKSLDCSSGPSLPRTKEPHDSLPSKQTELNEISSIQRFSSHDSLSLSLPVRLEGNFSSSLAWLYESELPTADRLLMLVEEYFAHIHPLRCNGFVHKPSFMQRLDEDFETCRQNESLLHVICALGAKFVALSHLPQSSPEAILTAGNQWAKLAKARIFIDLDDLSNEKLMTAILLYDHDLRIGSYASAFVLSGITARISQALQLNLENSADTFCLKPHSSAINNEARRRLMWSCYLLDSWVGSGVNQFTLLEDRDLKIQLPCHNHNFSLGIPCVTETLDEGNVLSFITAEQRPSDPCQNMGIEAYFIRLVSIRKKVLRYVKQLSTAKPPWQENSEFLSLAADFAAWRQSLPQSMLWNPGVIYARKESSELGALTLLWCTYHQSLVDLYRIGMPALFRIQKEIAFPPDQQDFLDDCRKVCFENSRNVSNIISEALRYGVKVLADTWFCIIAHDSTKVMLYYLKLSKSSIVRLDHTQVNGTISLIHQNLESLLQMRPMVATAEHCSVSVVKMMVTAGIQPQNMSLGAGYGQQNESGETSPPLDTPVQESPENVLNPLAIYRMARAALHDKDVQSTDSHSPSTQNIASSPHAALNSGRGQHGPRSVETPSRANQRHPQVYNSYHANQAIASIDQPYLPSGQAREDIPMTFGNSNALYTSGMGTTWDPADFAVMDMLDGGMAPWTADYLTDGQSGVDPFLFPF